jgi:hypothetical protein
MRRAYIFGLMVWVVLGSLPVKAGEIIDRIIAVVNNTPVMMSEWDEAWRCEALLAGRTPQSYTALEQQEIFNRLVDQELLRQQMRGFVLPAMPDADVTTRLHEVRTQLAASDAQWQAALSGAGITERELLYHLRRQMEIERFVDARFRAGIRIDDRSVLRYYREVFLPELHKAGAKDVPLDEVSAKIREILVQQQLAEQLTAWIQGLREQTEIRTPQEITTVEMMQSK